MRAFAWTILLTLLAAVPAPAQGPAASAPPPRPAKLQDDIRERAALEWHLLVSAPARTVLETAALGEELGLNRIATHRGQTVGPELARPLDVELTVEERARVRAAWEPRGVGSPVYHAGRLAAGDARRVFELARDLGARVVVASPDPTDLPAIEAVADELEIDLAVESRGAEETPAYADPAALMAALKARGRRVGASVDLRRWSAQGVQYQSGLATVKPRLRHVTLNDSPALEGFLGHMLNEKVGPVYFTAEVKDAAELERAARAFETSLRPRLAGLGGPRPAWRPGFPIRTSFVAAHPRLLEWSLVLADAPSPSPLLETAVRSAETGVPLLAASATRTVSAEHPRPLTPDLPTAERMALMRGLADVRARLGLYRVASLGEGEETRAVFALARALSIPVIVTSALPRDLAAVEALTREIGVSLAIESDDPARVAAALAGLGPRVGLSVAAKDVAAGGDRVRVVRLPGGAPDLAPVLRDLRSRQLKPLTFVADDLAAVEAYEKAVQPLLGEVVNQASRSLPIRGGDTLAAAVREKIASAVPRQAPARPRKKRKLLVLDICHLGMSHETIPHANHALDLMGRTTGAFETVFSNDLTHLRYDKIKSFDAVFLNNNVGENFSDPEVRDGLLRFVREGGGLGAVHGATYSARSWPELAEVLGATDAPHRIEPAFLKVDDPRSPLMKAFPEASFPYTDELYRFPHMGPSTLYSREKLHVLLSIDTARSDLVHGSPIYERPDGDYGLVWIKSYGKGRVYNNALGHLDTLFTTPMMLEHLLAAVQFLLGDLDADTTPSAQLARKDK